MCGIFGYVGPQDAVGICLAGLKRLEYRGYDSAGIAGGINGELAVSKVAGKVAVLEKRCEEQGLELDFAIAHTRWATHGAPNDTNAHPHADTQQKLAIVHNGIIENYEALREELATQNCTFLSETDTEVVAQLIASHFRGDLLKAVQQTVPLLEGSFAIAVVHQDFPHQVIVTANESPLAVGVGNGEAFIASDTSAFLTHTRDVVYLSDGEVAVVRPDSLDVYDATMAQVIKKTEELAHQAEEASKGNFEHYTLKEIFEQPQTIRNALLSRYVEDTGSVVLEDLDLEVDDLLAVKRVLILACGTSWNAGYIAAYLLEDMARIPAQVEISSEFRYKNPIVPDGTLVLAISQSGETADTLAAVRELKAKGARVVAVCNVHGSSLARESDSCLFLRAGAEIGVCSTKAFTSQLVVLTLFALMMARAHDMSSAEGRRILEGFKALPDQVRSILDNSESIAAVARQYANCDNFFFLGRRYMFPASLEGALKLKEMSYINANGYPAGEMKHGPIALINKDCPTVALCANTMTWSKMLSNLKEVKARNGPIIAVARQGTQGLDGVADHIITIPDIIDELASIPVSVVTQLLAYYIARERGADIDQPRNLAKSVTVE